MENREPTRQSTSNSRSIREKVSESWTSDFDRLMRAFESGVTVRLIMSEPLYTIPPDRSMKLVFEDDGCDDFDCFPVRSEDDEDSAIIGAVFRDDVDDQIDISAQEVMRPMHEVPIVASTDSIDRLITAMRERRQHHWLVLHEMRITGIVTRSDLGRLPVRMLALVRVVHLEESLTQLIRTTCPDDGWLACLTAKRVEGINQRFDEMKSNKEAIDRLACATLSDKSDVLKKCLGCRDDAKQLGRIILLRNDLMHGRTQESDRANIDDLLDCLETIDQLICSFHNRTVSANDHEPDRAM